MSLRKLAFQLVNGEYSQAKLVRLIFPIFDPSGDLYQNEPSTRMSV